MNVTVENLGPCKKLLRVEVAPEKVNEVFASVAKEFQRQVSLPGFRPGKAPKDMVLKRFGPDIEQEVKNKLTREGYKDAIRDKNISVLGQPDIEEIHFAKDEPFQFAATVETAPEFELPEYTGIPVKRPVGTVSDADVNRALTVLRERQQKFETVDRELREGDMAVVNYTGTCEGKPITDLAPAARGLTENKNFWVEAKPNSFIPGFAQQLIGAKAGDKRTINVDFPADFVTPQLQGKKGEYQVELVEVKERIMPALDDEFAKSFGAENLDQLREGVRRDLENEIKYKQDRSVRDQVVKGLLERVQFDLPESAVLHETRNIVYNIVDENKNRGVPMEAIEAQKDQIFASANLTAKDRVKAMFLLHKIADKEQIKVEQNEVLQRVQQLSYSYQMPVDKFIKELQKRDGVREIYEQLTTEKTVDFLLQKANMQDVPMEEKSE